MEAMAKHRTHSVEFKRQIAQNFIAGETLHALASRHDISRTLKNFVPDPERPDCAWVCCNTRPQTPVRK
jgi:hypothetical protein